MKITKIHIHDLDSANWGSHCQPHHFDVCNIYIEDKFNHNEHYNQCR